jgi:hypothetical protein
MHSPPRNLGGSGDPNNYCDPGMQLFAAKIRVFHIIIMPLLISGTCLHPSRYYFSRYTSLVELAFQAVHAAFFQGVGLFAQVFFIKSHNLC